MKYELPCGVVNDLLPSYIDDLTSEESNTAIKSHLDNCDNCRNAYLQMSENIDSNNIIINETELLKKSKKKFGKKLIKTSIIVALTVAIVLSTIYGLHFIYWGRRHFVLYDVKTVTVQQIDNNKDIYDITYDVSVRNWDHDIIPHTYRLEDDLRGEPGGYYFDGNSEYFTTGIKPIDFQIKVKIDISSVIPYEGMPEGNEALIIDVIKFSQFEAYDEFGKEAPRASLYMSDNQDAEIVFVIN
ncbi:MAG: zf-HC2 domain-containing protein [Eubacterium sp.]|nr:zf-HC2 domain-containing protein [Eubacterium sp.]